MDKVMELAKVIKASSEDKNKTSAYETQAEVLYVDGNTAYVHIPDGVERTPATMIINAKKGDSVRVRVSGGKAYVVGNVTSPPTDDSYAKKAETQAQIAQNAAEGAVKDAGIAREAASEAQKIANNVREDALQARSAAESAEKSAAQANTILGQMEEAAEAADTTLTQIYQDAKSAKDSADSAETSANTASQQAVSATRSADSALSQLGVIEEVVGALDWIASHGTYVETQDTEVEKGKYYFKVEGNDYILIPIIGEYVLTTDTELDANKTYYTRSGTGTVTYTLTQDTELVEGKAYFTRSGSGTTEDPYVYTAVAEPDVEYISTYYEEIDDPYVYTAVENPDVSEIGTYYEYVIDPSALGLYELSGVDESVQRYISSHLALTNEGLWLSTDESEYRVLLTSDGLEVRNGQGTVIAKFGENVLFSGDIAQRIGGENSYISFDPQTGQLSIIADSIVLGNQNTAEMLSQLNETTEGLQGQIKDQNAVISSQQERLENLDGYVEIDPNGGYMKVGRLDSDSHVWIGTDNSTPKVAINVAGNDVTYMEDDRMHAESAVVTNLYMQTTDPSTGNVVGEMGWVMRSNGHLSLKLIK